MASKISNDRGPLKELDVNKKSFNGKVEQKAKSAKKEGDIPSAIVNCTLKLHRSIIAGHSGEVISNLLLDGALRDKPCGDYDIPLNTAILHNRIRVMEDFYTLGFDLNSTKGKTTPLICAIRSAHIKAVQFLLLRDVNVLLADRSGHTPKQAVMAKGNSAITYFVMRQVVQAKNGQGAKPLELALFRNDIKDVKFLCKYGANVNETLSNGLKPLRYAVNLGHFDLVALLIQLGANETTALNDAILDRNERGVRYFFSRAKKETIYPTNRDDGPLPFALKSNRMAMARVMVEEGLDLQHYDADGETFLTDYVWEGNGPYVEALVQLGANLNFPAKDGMTPLISAIDNEDPSMCARLIRLGANVNYCSPLGKRLLPINMAIRISGPKSKEIIPLLIQSGVNLSAINGDGYTPLGYCAALRFSSEEAMLDRMRPLLTAGANVNQLCSPNSNPLSMSLVNRFHSVTRELIQAGGDFEEAYEINLCREVTSIWNLTENVSIKTKQREISVHFNEGTTDVTIHELFKEVLIEFYKREPQFEESCIVEIFQEVIRDIRNEELIGQKGLQLLEKNKVVVIMGGTDKHSIVFVLTKEKLFVCNRGEGSKALGRGVSVFSLDEKIDLKSLIINCDKDYKSVRELYKWFNSMNLKSDHFYPFSPQGGENCQWVGMKLAFFCVQGIRMGPTKRDAHREIYKKFTAFAREYILKKYLKQSKYPSRTLLTQVRQKIQKKAKSL